MGCRFTFDDGEQIDATPAPGETLLAVADRHGVTLLADCREGACLSCRGRMAHGLVAYPDRHQHLLDAAPLADDQVLCCIAEPASDDVEIVFGYPRAAVRPVRKMVLEVLEVVPLSHRVMALRGAIRGRFKLAFLPGQYLEVQVPGDGRRRSYSMASAAASPESVEFHVRLLPGGAMSEYVSQRAKPGDLIDVRGPLGVFYLRRRPAARLFVTGGTGLAPAIAMLKDLVSSDALESPVSILHGVTTRGDLYGLDEVRSLLSHFADASLAVALQEADDDWDGVCGHVTDLPIAQEVARLGGIPDVYLCGPPPMIQAVRQILDEACVPPDRIFAEAFSAAR